jgi:uncharacterized protein with FMN-binding domain
MESSGNRNIFITIAAVAVILVLVVGGYVLLQNKSTAPAAQESQNNTAPTNDNGASTDTNGSTGATYKDGTYTAEGDYITHGGPESISVTLTLKGGVIDSVDVKSEAKDAMSEQMQGMFISGYKPMVEGKNIDEVNLTKVSGSSLTPIGFNDALGKIKTQAKS